VEGSVFSVYMGVDVGTTKIAVLLLDTCSGDVKAVHVARNSSEITNAQGKVQGWSEWDAEQAVELTFEAIAEVASLGVYEEIKGIGVTGQMHGTVLVSQDQRPLSPFIGWQDQRCNRNMPGTRITYIERIIELAGEDGFLREGCRPATGYMGSTLFWLKENSALPSKPATACFLPDLLAMKMTGEKPLTDPSNASSSGIYDIISRKWDTELIKSLGLQSDFLPEVKRPGELVGGLTLEAAEKTGLKEGTPVCVACGDNQASFLGSVANLRETVLINIGTGGQLSLWVPKYSAVEGVDTRCFLDESYLLVGASLCGGGSYALLNRFFKEVGRAFFEAKQDGELYDKMTCLASEVPSGSDGLRCEPLFTGTRLNPNSRAIWRGMGESNFSPGHMVRALLEGTAEQFKMLYDNILRGSVSPRAHLVGSGNAIRKNSLLTEILSHTFNMPIRTPKNTEEASFGAALLVALACGEFENLEEAARIVTYQ
jgi:sugar (pentulose or hexulose) kinase